MCSGAGEVLLGEVFFLSTRTAAQGVTVKAMSSEKIIAAEEPMGIGRM